MLPYCFQTLVFGVSIEVNALKIYSRVIGEARHYWLNAIEQPEGRKAPDKQGEAHPPEPRVAACNERRRRSGSGES